MFFFGDLCPSSTNGLKRSVCLGLWLVQPTVSLWIDALYNEMGVEFAKIVLPFKTKHIAIGKGAIKLRRNCLLIINTCKDRPFERYTLLLNVIKCYQSSENVT